MNTLTAKEIKEGMTQGAWEPDFMTYKQDPKLIYTGIGVKENVGGGEYTEMVFETILPDNDGQYITAHKNIKADVHAACTAVNSTYGKNLDPEKYEEVVKALETISNWLVCASITSAEDMAQSFPEMLSTAEAALNNAKIK